MAGERILIVAPSWVGDAILSEPLVALLREPYRNPIVDVLAHSWCAPVYARIDAPATAAQKAVLQKLSPQAIAATDLAGDPIQSMLTSAPGNGAAIGGLKVVTAQGWFAARPSGTEEVYKLYAESFRGSDHLQRIQNEAQAILAQAFASSTK